MFRHAILKLMISAAVLLGAQSAFAENRLALVIGQSAYRSVPALPNPATLYLLEVYPYLLEHFHQWHRRMGIDRSPLGSLPCC